MKIKVIEENIRSEFLAQARVTALLMLVCAQYFLGTVFFVGMPVVEAAWMVMLVYLLLTVRVNNVVPVLLVYMGLFAFYTLGILYDPFGLASTSYYRTILTWFVFSSLILGFIISSEDIKIRSYKVVESLDVIGFLFIASIFVWSFFSLKDLNLGLVIDYRELTGDGYLTLADTFALFSISYLCRLDRSRLIFLAAFVMSLVVIFFLGSRSALIFYPASVFLLMLNRFGFSYLFIWISAFFAAFFYFFNSSLNFESAAFFRFNTFFELKNDESSSVRGAIREQMIDSINENPECFLIPCHPEQGWYEHSFLSIIQYFGFFGFLLIIISTFIVVFKWRDLINKWYFPVFIYCALSLLISRAWVTVVFPVFIAFLIGVFLFNKRRPIF